MTEDIFDMSNVRIFNNDIEKKNKKCRSDVTNVPKGIGLELSTFEESYL